MLRVRHVPQPVLAAAVGLGLAYLAIQAVFAVAFARPSALGWGGFAVVAVIVLAITTAVGQFLAGDSRRPR